eukprot:scaffold10384_cov30-Tisochrysis_lutea.AAC.4
MPPLETESLACAANHACPLLCCAISNSPGGLVAISVTTHAKVVSCHQRQSPTHHHCLLSHIANYAWQVSPATTTSTFSIDSCKTCVWRRAWHLGSEEDVQ